MQYSSFRSEPDNTPSPMRRAIWGPTLGAAATFVVLVGAVTVTESPSQISDVASMVVSSELSEILPPSTDVYEESVQVLAPATGHYEDPGLQVTYEVYG